MTGIVPESTAAQAPDAYEQPAGPCVVVIFGASGDLTKRKLMPALYNLGAQQMFPKEFAIMGAARSPKNDETFRQDMHAALQEFGTQKLDGEYWTEFEPKLHYTQGQYDDPESFAVLKARLEEIDRDFGTGGNYLFYLSVPPDSFATIVEGLGASGLAKEEEGKWRRVIVEKPFGHDLDSARELNRRLAAVLQETQTYRIDHYLGKETVQNLLVFRFGNGIFEPVWNRRYVEYVQITVAESIGVESRGSFYEGVGALRDVMQNHMFMLMSLIAMEPPSSLLGESVRGEKTKVFEAIRPMTPEQVARNTVRGQYGPGKVKAEDAIGYRQEKGVDPNSQTETFATVKLGIENWRWAGVPFYLRTGKRLATRATDILIRFREAPLLLYGDAPMGRIGPNRLIIHIQPCEAMTLQIRAKTPGPTMKTQAVALDFDYADLGGVKSTGYETLLYDCMQGDPTLFHRIDTVEAAWKIATPILQQWKQYPAEFPNYAAGTWGPAASEELIARDGHTWWTPDC
ncbi:MAG: glucose-6-phosphate dehydrogenase [Candidatus Sumerlaeaceae bacterium]